MDSGSPNSLGGFGDDFMGGGDSLVGEMMFSDDGHLKQKDDGNEIIQYIYAHIYTYMYV